MNGAPYGLSVELDLPYAQARQKITEALKEQGFGILTEIDVQQTLKQKIGADMPAYVILGACNPALAHASLQVDVNLGLLLPCNVVVREVPGGSVVSVLDPLLMSEVSRAEGLEQIAALARAKIERALDALSHYARRATPV